MDKMELVTIMKMTLAKITVFFSRPRDIPVSLGTLVLICVSLRLEIRLGFLASHLSEAGASSPG
jgi:hypothetical protein